MTKPFPSIIAPRDNDMPGKFDPLKWSACFMQPAMISDVRSWQQHIPFAFAAVQMLQPKCFVELGTHKGDSYLAFCQAVAALDISSACYAIDTWKGDDHAGHYGESVYLALSAYHDRHYAGFSRLIRSTFDEALNYFPDRSIDLLHIDGRHTYEDVKHDFESWLPKLNERGVVMFHDINVREREFGVWRFWSEIADSHPSFAFTHGNGLGILAVGPDCPEALSPLLKTDESGAARIRQFYFQLGSKIEITSRLTAESQTRLDILRDAITALDQALDSVGVKHDELPTNADEHLLGGHAIWTHRGLAQLAGNVHERNLRIRELDTKLAEAEQTAARQEKLLDETATKLAEKVRQARAMDEALAEAHAARERAGQQLEQMEEKHRLLDAQLSDRSADLNLLNLRNSELDAHARRLEQGMSDLRGSLSWKLTSPLRAVGSLFSSSPSVNFEQRLYRSYYALPGLSHARKRALVLWAHRHAGWLTKNTLSYQFYRQAQDFVARQPAAKAADGTAQVSASKRMDQAGADVLIASWHATPRISIVMPVYNVEARWLEAAVESVQRQFYPHWELCIADDASTREETRRALDKLQAANDPRFKIVRLASNRGIALASNAAFELATGEFVGLLDHDDELTRDALLEVVRTINAHDVDLIYSDEDKTDEKSVRRNPFFKPDFSLEYFFSNNYLCHFTVLRTHILKRIGGFREGVDGAQDFDLFLRFTEHTQRVAHIPKVLYHWRMIEGSTAAVASAKPYTWEAGRLALEHTLRNRGLAAHAEQGPFPNTYRVRYDIKGEPLVSILIPFRDKPELLRVCIDSILQKTDYANYEIVGIDNGSTQADTQALVCELEKRDRRVRFVRYDAPFNFSAINNFGVRHAHGEHLLLLNNDTEVLSAEWLRAMLEHSQRNEVGVVGARLLYPDDTVQHAGVVIDRHVVAMHPFQYTPAQHPGYAALPHLLHNVSAVTFACAMTRRNVFEQLAGLDEMQLPVCYNDVDYCLRAREAGYAIVYTPYAVLRHFESKSRGIDDHLARQTRFRDELAFMQQRHADILRDGDPYYNPNLSLGVQSGYHPDPHYADHLPL